MNTYFPSRKCLVGLLGFFAVLIVGVLAAAAADALEIVRFDANPVNELVPGTELVFRLEGTPQAKALVTISSIRQPITLRETNTGFYEGSYTIRTGDRLPSNPDVRATLRQGNLTTTARLTQPLVTAAQTPSRGLDIQRFTMEPNRIEPGTELVFTLEGTPNATATFGIKDVSRDITMTEVQPGVYEGRYTVRICSPLTTSARGWKRTGRWRVPDLPHRHSRLPRQETSAHRNKRVSPSKSLHIATWPRCPKDQSKLEAVAPRISR